MKSFNKNGQIGMISGLVFGIAGLVIAIIIALLLVVTLTDANLLTATRTDNTESNETTGGINITGYTVNGAATTNVATGTYIITHVWTDVAGTTTIVPLANVSVSAAGVVTNATIGDYGTNATVSYTYQTLSNEEVSTSAMSANLTQGVDNVSGKIPTVLLVAAIILILGILGILVGVWQKMRMSQGI